MDSDRWRQVDSLLQAVLERPPAERDAFLRKACASDEELEREVRSLLSSQQQASSFLQTPAIELAAQAVGRQQIKEAQAGAFSEFLIGRTVSQYRILEKLGAGGMGEVYRARDTNLSRDVAIKILPRAFTSDPERLVRFEREARTLAALNHPHIGAIYGLERNEGIRALVLELVEGDTLGDRIRRNPIPFKEALAIARQIAHALDAAHGKGIVHRDLKPANVKITPEGVVKVLDFGLAKAMVGDASVSDHGQAPTETAGGTGEGVILGTTAYMSPEQARGKPIDKRTDIWAFGCVLFEMLSGRTAFARESSSDTIVAVLEHEPDWNALPPLPPRLSALLRCCLQKDPKLRLRDIGDARNDLEDEIASAASSVRTTYARDRRLAVIPWLIAGIAAAALLASRIIPRLTDRSSSEIHEVSRTAVLLPDDEELERGDGSSPLALSPDGKRLVYVAASEGTTQLFMRRLDELAPAPIPNTRGASNPFFSPDSTWVAYFAGGQLQKVSAGGGPPITICPIESRIVHGSWAKDGTVVISVRGLGLFTVSAAGGTPRSIPDTLEADWPEVLPDGKTLLVTWGGSGLVTMSVDGGSRRVVASGSNDFTRGPWFQQAKGTAPQVLGAGYLLQARYVRTGHLVYGQSANVIRAIAFDATSVIVRGSSISLVDSVYQAPAAGAVYFSISETGLLAYSAENRQRELSWVDREGHAMPVSGSREAFRQPRISPNGRHVAVAIDSETRRSDIWIYDVQRGSRTRLTNDEHNLDPVWTRDGVRVVFVRSGTLATQPVDGNGSASVLLPGPGDWPSSWSPDGHTLLFTRNDSRSGGDLWELPANQGTRARPLLVRPSSSEIDARFSPNGRWVAYSSNESGRFEIYVARYPKLGEKVAVSTGGGELPVWSHDGKELFYRQGQSLMAVQVDTMGNFRAKTPKVLFSNPSYVGMGGDLSFDVAPDSRRFLMIRDRGPSGSHQLVVVHNWFEDLKRHASNLAN